MSKDINNLRNVSEKSEVDMINDAVDDLNAQNVSIDLNQLTEQESFVRVLHNVMHQPAPNQAYTVRSRAFLMQKFSEEHACLLYTSPSPRDLSTSRMPSSA